MWADRLNGKWMVFVALLLCCVGNLVLPLFAAESFWFAVAARIAVGASDACLMPACNSLITSVESGNRNQLENNYRFVYK
ncbi:unnamed protein product [Strongylus vulgaris]|uniref:Major facilitator superfamily (MFS) profile domain-containing protein n=1 Tax=Strongylus vulgaris TaxID=40348 RepID=A0A3P7M246_STRVU|nr:unnamed protein product [Strongylus vulgaris]